MENTKYTQTEKEITSTTVHGKECIGCKKHKKDIMIAYTDKNSDEITDLFFTDEQAKSLLKRLKERIEENKE